MGDVDKLEVVEDDEDIDPMDDVDVDDDDDPARRHADECA